MAHPLDYERFYQQLDSLARTEVPNHTIRLAVNEYGLAIGEARQHGMDAALYGARMMLVFERASPLVAMSAISDMVNGWPGGIIQAGRQGEFVTPLYHANRMFAAHLGSERLHATVESPSFGANTARQDSGTRSIDAVGSRSADGKKIYVKIVNVDPAQSINLRVDLHGAVVAPGAEWELLVAPTPTAQNSFSAPDAVAPRVAPLKAGRAFTVRLPPSSVSVITLDVSG
jgi:alpha-N-arabinofuranosidase